MPTVTRAGAIANEVTASNNDPNAQQRKKPNKPKAKPLTKEHAAVKLKSSLIELNQDVDNLKLAITHMSKICKGQGVPPVLRDMKGCLDRMQTVQNSLKDDVLPVLACERTVQYLYSRMRWEARKNRRDGEIKVILGQVTVLPEEKEAKSKLKSKSNKRKRKDTHASSSSSSSTSTSSKHTSRTATSNLPSHHQGEEKKSELDTFEKIQCIAPEAPILQLPSLATSKKSTPAKTKSTSQAKQGNSKTSSSSYSATTSSQSKKRKLKEYTIIRPQNKAEFEPEEAMDILLKTSCRDERKANIREWVLRKYIAVDGVTKTEDLFQNYKKGGIIEDEWHKVPWSYRCTPLMNSNATFPVIGGGANVLASQTVPMIGTTTTVATLPAVPITPVAATALTVATAPITPAATGIPVAATTTTTTTTTVAPSITPANTASVTATSSTCASTTSTITAAATVNATHTTSTNTAAPIDTAASASAREATNPYSAAKSSIVGNYHDITMNTTTAPLGTTNDVVESTGLTNVGISASTASMTSTLRLAHKANPLLKMSSAIVPPNTTLVLPNTALLTQYANMKPKPPTTLMLKGNLVRIFHPVNATEFHPQEAMFILSKLPKAERAANMKEWVEKKQVPIQKSLLYKKFRKHMKGHDIGESWHTKPGRPIGVNDTKPRAEPRKTSIRKQPENLQLIKPPNGEQQFDFITALESLRKMDDKNRVANMKYWCEMKYAPIPLSTFMKKYRKFRLGQDVGNDWFKKPGRPPLFTNEQFEKMIKEEQAKKGSEKLSRNELKQILNDRFTQMSQEKGKQADGSHSVGSSTIKNYMNLAGIHDVIVKLNKPPKQRYWSRRKKVPQPNDEGSHEQVGTEELNLECPQHDEVPHFDNFQHNESGVFF